jgi:hypothetical protein
MIPCPVKPPVDAMRLPRRQFLQLAVGAGALPAVSRIARAQVYPTRPRPPALYRAEDIGSVLKGGAKVCQRQLVNEVLGPLVNLYRGFK